MEKSKFNIFLDSGSKKIVFNSVSCALAEIDNRFWQVYNNSVEFNSNPEMIEIRNQMKKGNFLIDSSTDELAMLKFKNLSGKFNSTAVGLTIAPTLACNFKCPYCYESEVSGVMSTDIQDKIIDYVSDQANKKKDVSITWYGGEPLLAANVIFHMSAKFIIICENAGVKYSAYMISNGYLLNDSIINKMIKSKINGIQITIDGPPDIHNQRRKLKDQSLRNSFDTILENVGKVKKAGIKCNIRINVDKTNHSHIYELLKILKKEKLNTFPINLGQVTSYTDSCSSISGSCYFTKEFADICNEFQKYLYDDKYYGNNTSEYLNYPNYPGVKANYCCADSISAHVIDPMGFMYKCWNDVGNHNKSVGNITSYNDETIIPNEKQLRTNIDYILWSPFNDPECMACEVLPICMGGCPYNGLRTGKNDCEKWKYSIRNVILETYKQKTEGYHDS